MQHERKNRTLGRSKNQKAALMRGLAISMIENGKVQTTEAKAKELRPFMERLVTYGKKSTVASKRSVSSKLGEPKQLIVQKLFNDIAPGYKDRAGGYTRIIKMGRTAAGRSEAIVEFV